jgi:hypothetical protein
MIVHFMIKKKKKKEYKFDPYSLLIYQKAT